MEIRRFAVISDIHGNSLALTSVLADIDRRGIGEIVNLGDSLYGPLDPAGTARLLLQRTIVSVSGNEDRILIDVPPDDGHNSTLRYTLDSLTAEHIDWLKTLPPVRVWRDTCLLCHGTPEDDERYLLRDVTAEGVRMKDAAALSAELAEVTADVILCGHDHVTADVMLPDGRRVFNPGSVGLPAYDDDRPYAHVMQAGSPHARYGIATFGGGGWRFETIAVSYDWDAAAAQAEKNGRADWAAWLVSGRAE